MIEETQLHANTLSSRVRTNSAPPNGKIRRAAEQFESVLLGNLFQKLQDSVSLSSGQDEDSSSRSFGELGIGQLATSAAKSGGIGIAEMVTRYLDRKASGTAFGSSPLKLYKDAPINELYRQNSEVVRK